MQFENKILYENIRHFRNLLTEGVSDAGIIDAIQNHEYIYIYYVGDENNKMGYRTVRPYVLGTTKEGNKVLRAWQDNRKSVSYRSPERRPDHEYWTDDFDNKEKPGWRLFRVDRISSVYPTGNKFVDKDGNVIIPKKYKEGSDDQMKGGIIAYVSAGKVDVETGGGESINEPNVSIQQVGSSQADVEKSLQTVTRGEFAGADVKNRRPTSHDIEKLYTNAKKIFKKSPNNLVVVIDKNNHFKLKNIRIKDKLPPNVVVGDLTNLYDKFVRQTKPVAPEQDKFFKDSISKYEQEKASQKK